MKYIKKKKKTKYLKTDLSVRSNVLRHVFDKPTKIKHNWSRGIKSCLKKTYVNRVFR